MPRVLVAGDPLADSVDLPIVEHRLSDRRMDFGQDGENTDMVALMLQPDPLRGARGLVWGILISLVAWVLAGVTAWLLLRG